MPKVILVLALAALVNAIDYAHPRIEDVIPYWVNPPNVQEMEADFWRTNAQLTLQNHINKKINLNKAKNIILFMGDGMALNTITSARILKGQRQGRAGEEEILNFEKFPFTGLSKTYCANAQVADSACSATAYLCGVKTNILRIGVNAKVAFNNCTESSDPANQVSSIAAWAQAAGMSTGIVTTTSLTHASPSGTFGHVANRLWECDTDITAFTSGKVDTRYCLDLAQQLITKAPGKNFDVMLGGGMGKFLPKTKLDAFGRMGERNDKRDLLKQWKLFHPNGEILTNRDELLNVNVSTASHIMGVFESYLMQFHLKANAKTQPTLAEMTELAIKKLQQNENGFFLFVEGGLIDFANHDNKATIALDETLELEKAIQKAIDMTRREDTLIVVTSDHAHPLSISGYPMRGNSILGINKYDSDSNGIPHMTLNYALGPNQYTDSNGIRLDLTDRINGNPDFIFPSYIPRSQGNHGGDDVGIFALGPCAHLFSGSMEENVIPHIMAYAACIGDGLHACDAYQP